MGTPLSYHHWKTAVQAAISILCRSTQGRATCQAPSEPQIKVHFIGQGPLGCTLDCTLRLSGISCGSDSAPKGGGG
eukprot:9493565-Alexandrium_andersonii.AAC.1